MWKRYFFELEVVEMKLIIIGMALTFIMQWVGLMFVDFSELGITLIVWGIKLMPLSIAAIIVVIGLKILWRNKNYEDN